MGVEGTGRVEAVGTCSEGGVEGGLAADEAVEEKGSFIGLVRWSADIWCLFVGRQNMTTSQCWAGSVYRVDRRWVCCRVYVDALKKSNQS